MNEPEIRKMVDERCYLIEKDAKLKISEGSRKLITTIIALVGEDPHPGWRERGDLDSRQRRLAEALPIILLRTAAGLEFPRRPYEIPPLEGNINAFDLLHRMTWITETFCPFRKR